jgi:hypothetical protein
MADTQSPIAKGRRVRREDSPLANGDRLLPNGYWAMADLKCP